MPPANLDASLVNDPFMVENHNSSSLAAPSSYMVRTRYENRPWSGSDNGAADDIDDDIQQLDRYKATSKKTNISEQFQFQQRVAAKKAAYRAVLAGDRPSSDRKLVSDTEDDDHEKNDETERLSQVLSETTGTEPSEAIILNSVTSEAARLARAKRLATAQTTPYNDPSPTSVAGSGNFFQKQEEESQKVRQMRAHRLRTSLKQSSDELLLQSSLEERRARLAEEERLAEIKKQQEFQKLKDEEQQRQFQKLLREQQSRDQERQRLEQIRQNYRESTLPKKNNSPTNSLDGGGKITPSRQRGSPSPRRKLRRRHSDTEIEAPTLMEELQEILRDSGLFKTCVSSCFGEEDMTDNNVENSLTVTKVRSGKTKRASLPSRTMAEF